MTLAGRRRYPRGCDEILRDNFSGRTPVQRNTVEGEAGGRGGRKGVEWEGRQKRSIATAVRLSSIKSALFYVVAQLLGSLLVNRALFPHRTTAARASLPFCRAKGPTVPSPTG